MALQISIRESADVTILDLRGKSTIDGGESELLSEHLRKLIANGARKVLLNLADLRQVDSTGVGTIVGTYVSLKRRGGELKLLCPRGRVLDVLTLFHLLDNVPSFEDEAEALASFELRVTRQQPESFAASVIPNRLAGDGSLTTPCSSGIAPSPEKIALLVASGGDVDNLIADVLASEGWSIQRVDDTQTALALAKARRFDLIITGRETRVVEDVELLRKIRSSRPHVRLIILTDKFTPGDVLSAMREGAFSYFSAPFDASELAETLRAAMSDPCWDDGIEVLSGTPEWVSLSARCDLATANRLVQFLHGVKDPSIPEADMDQVTSAFKEILFNAMEHGAHFDPSQHVEISFIRARRAIACRVKDFGKGFSLEELRHAAAGSSPEDLFSHVRVRDEGGMRPGGFGILLAKRLVDELIYNEKGNEVVLVKYLNSPKSAMVQSTG